MRRREGLFAAVGVLLIQRGATEVLGQLAVGLLLTAYLVRNVKRLSQPNR